jgi:pimeloyl-ACP methyl ester carboxylesterase
MRQLFRFVRIVLVGLFILILAGAVYEQIGQRLDRRRLPQIGRSVDIGNRKLNIFCSGEGKPTVIFDSGAREPGYRWAAIQAEVAKNTQACCFDRAGYGWSDPGPYPHASEETAKDLHDLLRRAGLPPPYILVGHSLGGLNVRVYAGMYLNEVAGIVFVDSAHEDEPKRAPAFMLGRSAPRILWRPIDMLVEGARAAGVIRLFTPAVRLSDDVSQRTPQQILNALELQPKTIATLGDPSTGVLSYEQAQRVGTLGDKPVIVLTRGKIPNPAQPTERDRQYAAYMQVWMHEIQPKIARLSTRGKQIIVENSGHEIPDEAPEAVVSAVLQVLAESSKGSMLTH